MQVTLGFKPGDLTYSNNQAYLTTLSKKYESKPIKNYICNSNKKPYLSKSFEARGKCKNHNLYYPNRLASALLYQEDRAFFKHYGFSTREFRIALINHYFKGKKLRGSSTITQQLARSMFQLKGRTFQRKLKELRIARYLEVNLTKKQILEYYLNIVYFGQNKYGLYDAIRYYFNKSASSLSTSEISFLIALLPSPELCRTVRKCHNKKLLRRKYRIEYYLKSIN